MRTVAKLALAVAALAVVLGGAAAPALAVTAPAPAAGVRVVRAAGDANTAPGDTAGQSGQNITKQRQNADATHTRNKAIIGGIAVVLLVIVYFGHRQRSKSRVRKKNLQNAKS